MKPRPRVFDHNPEIYEELIDWPRRLKNEEPLLRRLIERFEVQRIVDVACGSGQHAAQFHSWGLEVEGADISRAMIERCRSRFGESDRLRWVVRSFDQPVGPPGSFDAAVCLGNSLALAPDTDTIRRAIHEMMAALRPGGLCLVQVVNLWRLPEGPPTWQNCRRVRRGDSDRILLKGIHRVGSRGFINLLELTLEGDEVEGHFDTPTFLGLEVHELVSFFRQAGGKPVVQGSLQGVHYDRDQSPDIVVVVERETRREGS
jgi:SAM-dependent methyltransferase